MACINYNKPETGETGSVYCLKKTPDFRSQSIIAVFGLMDVFPYINSENSNINIVGLLGPASLWPCHLQKLSTVRAEGDRVLICQC